MKISRFLAAILGLVLLAVASDAANKGIAPDPVLHFTDNNGYPCVGCKLFVYLAGTTTKTASYTNYGGATPNSNPVVLNARGEANVWLTPGTLYKFVLSPPTDTDPPTNPFWTVDNLSSASGGGGSSIPYGTGVLVTGSSTIASANVTVSVTGSAPNTQILPVSPALWEIHTIKDAAGNAHTNPITISGNGNSIDGFGTSYVMAVNWRSITVQWNGTIWIIE